MTPTPPAGGGSGKCCRIAISEHECATFGTLMGWVAQDTHLFNTMIR